MNKCSNEQSVVPVERQHWLYGDLHFVALYAVLLTTQIVWVACPPSRSSCSREGPVGQVLPIW